MAIRVYLANNHDVIREGLKSILLKNPIFNICGEYTANVDTIYSIERVKPNLLFIDISSDDNVIMKNVNRLRITCPKMVIIAMIHFNEYHSCYDSINMEGISGFFMTDVKVEELFKGISIVLSNKIYIQDSISDLLKNADDEKKSDKYKINSLTKRELEVLIQVANGMFNKEIATSLSISERTVKNHLSNIFKKIDVSDRTQAAVFAIKNSIVNI